MIEQPLGQKYSQFVNILILIFPIVINTLQVAGDIVLFILAMMGVFVAISQKLSPFAIKEIKVFSYLTIGYFTAVCLSFVSCLFTICQLMSTVFVYYLSSGLLFVICFISICQLFVYYLSAFYYFSAVC